MLVLVASRSCKNGTARSEVAPILFSEHCLSLLLSHLLRLLSAFPGVIFSERNTPSHTVCDETACGKQ